MQFSEAISFDFYIENNQQSNVFIHICINKNTRHKLAKCFVVYVVLEEMFITNVPGHDVIVYAILSNLLY